MNQPSALVRIQRLGLTDYLSTLEAMRRFTAQRDPDTADEIWLTEHPPVFTLGLAGRREHVLDAGSIPVIGTERGGQVTYHGPGQQIAYTLIDIRRRGLTVRALVTGLEAAAIDCLAGFGVAAVRKDGAPGVYVADVHGQAGAKIAALGLKISRGCSFHGLALNVDMDLEPFRRIDPCGYPGLAVTDLRRAMTAGPAPPTRTAVADELVAALLRALRAEA